MVAGVAVCHCHTLPFTRLVCAFAFPHMVYNDSPPHHLAPHIPRTTRWRMRGGVIHKTLTLLGDARRPFPLIYTLNSATTTTQVLTGVTAPTTFMPRYCYSAPDYTFYDERAALPLLTLLR